MVKPSCEQTHIRTTSKLILSLLLKLSSTPNNPKSISFNVGYDAKTTGDRMHDTHQYAEEANCNVLSSTPEESRHRAARSDHLHARARREPRGKHLLRAGRKTRLAEKMPVPA